MDETRVGEVMSATKLVVEFISEARQRPFDEGMLKAFSQVTSEATLDDGTGSAAINVR